MKFLGAEKKTGEIAAKEKDSSAISTENSNKQEENLAADEIEIDDEEPEINPENTKNEDGTFLNKICLFIIRISILLKISFLKLF